MRRIKRYISKDTLRTIYNALVQPHLYYAILAWGCSSYRIHKLQKRAIRIICGVKYNAHTDRLFKDLFILKVQDIFTIQYAPFYYRYSHNNMPLYFRQFFNRNADIHTHNTRNRNEVHLYQYRLHSTRNCVRFNVPNFINNLPDNVTEKNSNSFIMGVFSIYENLFHRAI